MTRALVLLTILALLVGCSSTKYLGKRTFRESETTQTLTDSVEIVTEPSGARVYLGDKLLGETPLTVNLEYTEQKGVVIEYDIYKESGKEVRKNRKLIDKLSKTDQQTYNIIIYLDGYQKQELEITVPAEKPRRLVFLNPLDKVGTITLTSVPEGCEIFVDGAYVGNTPATLNLPDGTHKLELKANNFKIWVRNIKIFAGSKTQIRAELESR